MIQKIEHVDFEEVDEFSDSSRGEGGLGSTVLLNIWTKKRASFETRCEIFADYFDVFFRLYYLNFVPLILCSDFLSRSNRLFPDLLHETGYLAEFDRFDRQVNAIDLSSPR